jgi:hypothetical protein
VYNLPPPNEERMLGRECKEAALAGWGLLSGRGKRRDHNNAWETTTHTEDKHKL